MALSGLFLSLFGRNRAGSFALGVTAAATLLTMTASPADAGHRLFTNRAVGGGLMSYGPRRDEQFRRTASMIDRVLKGARPDSLPVEEPTTFEMLFNLRTARALGLKIPQQLLLRAEEVIE